MRAAVELSWVVVSCVRPVPSMFTMKSWTVAVDVMREHDPPAVGRDVGQERVANRARISSGNEVIWVDAAAVRPFTECSCQLPVRLDDMTMRPFVPA